MRGVVGLGQVLEVQMRIHLRRRYARMPQHFLHRAQVAEDCSTCVAKEWRSTCGWTCTGRPARLAQCARRARTTPAAMRSPRAPTNSAGTPARASRARASSQASIAARAFAPTGTAARLAALAGHGHLGVAADRVRVRQIEADQFRQAQPGGIGELEYSLVAQFGRRLGRRIQQLSGRLGESALGRPLGALGACSPRQGLAL